MSMEVKTGLGQSQEARTLSSLPVNDRNPLPEPSLLLSRACRSRKLEPGAEGDTDHRSFEAACMYPKQ